MAQDAPPVIQSIINEDEFGGFRITIPSATPAVQYGCGCALAFWAFVMGIALLCLISDIRPGRDFRGVLTSLAVWMVLGVLAAYILAYVTTGRQVVMIDGKTLVVRFEMAGYSSSRTFDLPGVRNLRPDRSHDKSFWFVAFDHGGQTHSFGAGLSQHEVRRLVKTIRQRFPIKDELDDVEPLPIGR